MKVRDREEILMQKILLWTIFARLGSSFLLPMKYRVSALFASI